MPFETSFTFLAKNIVLEFESKFCMKQSLQYFKISSFIFHLEIEKEGGTENSTREISSQEKSTQENSTEKSTQSQLPKKTQDIKIQHTFTPHT